MSSRVLQEKIRMRAILKESMANYISLESLINVLDFEKKYELPVFYTFCCSLAQNVHSFVPSDASITCIVLS